MKNRLKTVIIVFRSFFVTANVIVVLILIASAYSDRISPVKSMLSAYLGLSFPILTIMNLCFILYWLFLQKWKYILISLIAFLLCYNALESYFPYHKQTKEIPDNVIKILTYNVMGFGYKVHTKDMPNPTVQYIANSGADIVCIQECALGSSRDFLTAGKLIKALSVYKYHSIIPIGTSGILKFSITVFSKYPITKSRRINYKSAFNGSAIHELNIRGKRVTLVNNHLESFKLTTEDKSHYSAFLKNISPENFDEVKASIPQKLGNAFRLRASQAEVIAEEIKKVDTEYIIVCGDFNDTPISYAHRIIKGDLIDSHAESGRGPGITYNENYFWFRIDNIFHSANMKSINCTVDKVRYSDHYPLWCYLQMK